MFIASSKVWVAITCNMKCHRGGSSEGLMAFNGCSLAEVRGDYVWGGELCCQGNQIGNILGTWKKNNFTSYVTSLLSMFVATMFTPAALDFWFCLARPWQECQLLLTKRRGGSRSTMGLSWYGKNWETLTNPSRDARFLLMFFETGQYFGFEWCLENVS